MQYQQDFGNVLNPLSRRHLPIVTISLIIINVLVFLYTEWSAGSGGSENIEHMVSLGAMVEENFFVKREYFRIITHFFLHFGFEHLVNNMISLGVLGYALEPQLGKFRFFIVYFLSGIFAGMCSILYNMLAGELFVVSAGASGAIYGLMGALLALMIFGRRWSVGSEIPRFILYIAISVYSGMQDASIDNAAHVGGLIAGFFLCGILLIVEKIKERR